MMLILSFTLSSEKIGDTTAEVKTNKWYAQTIREIELLLKKLKTMGFLSNLLGGAHEGVGAQIINALTADLNLSADQTEKVKGFFQQFRTEKQEAKAGFIFFG